MKTFRVKDAASPSYSPILSALYEYPKTLENSPENPIPLS